MLTTETLQGNTNATKRKSVALTPDERRQLKAYMKKYRTVSEAAESIGISRQVLDRVNIVGSGSPDNITVIRQKIGQAA